MTSGDRLKALIVIWIVSLLILAVTVLNMPNSAAAWAWAAVSGGVLLVTQLATFAITRAQGPENESAAREQVRGKAKRSDTALIERLIDSMSDEELAAFRRRLIDGMSTIGDDGEIVPLDQPKRRASGAARDGE